jgi:hypothetical protein
LSSSNNKRIEESGSINDLGSINSSIDNSGLANNSINGSLNKLGSIDRFIDNLGSISELNSIDGSFNSSIDSSINDFGSKASSGALGKDRGSY